MQREDNEENQTNCECGDDLLARPRVGGTTPDEGHHKRHEAATEENSADDVEVEGSLNERLSRRVGRLGDSRASVREFMVCRACCTFGGL